MQAESNNAKWIEILDQFKLAFLDTEFDWGGGTWKVYQVTAAQQRIHGSLYAVYIAARSGEAIMEVGPASFDVNEAVWDAPESIKQHLIQHQRWPLDTYDRHRALDQGQVFWLHKNGITSVDDVGIRRELQLQGN